MELPFERAAQEGLKQLLRTLLFRVTTSSGPWLQCHSRSQSEMTLEERPLQPGRFVAQTLRSSPLEEGWPVALRLPCMSQSLPPPLATIEASTNYTCWHVRPVFLGSRLLHELGPSPGASPHFDPSVGHAFPEAQNHDVGSLPPC